MDEKLHLIDKSLESINEEIYLRNDYIDTLVDFANTRQIVVVEWQRRTGKSYIILWLIKKLWIKDKTFYLNHENDVRWLIKNVSDLEDLFEEYCAKRWEPERIIIDEIQDIKWRENFIRARYVPKRYNIIISGSNSHLLSWELATYLSWRYLNFYVCPLGFDEYQDMIETMNLQSDKSFISYIQSGWLPEVVKINQDQWKDNYTSAVLDTILVKDIMRRRTNTWNKNPELITQILSYLANVTWSIVSVKNIVDAIQKEQDLKVTQPTITNYIDEIVASFAIHKAQRYNILWKHLFQQKDKYYFNDIWIRNSFWFDFRLDRWKLLENVVYLHLIRRWYKVYIWDINGKEIDFVAKKWNNIQYFQVAWSLATDTVEDREFGNLSSIKDAYPKHVISVDVPWKSNSNWINVRNIERFIKEFK